MVSSAGTQPQIAMTKPSAHDKWVCLGCRWTAKIPLVEVHRTNRPSYRCPKCRVKMIWTGTAFRPPPKHDDEAWSVVGQLLATGFRYMATRTRRRVPRTEKELNAWIAEQAEPVHWLPEHRLRIQHGRGFPVVHSGPKKLSDGEPLLVWDRGHWRGAKLRLHGDGNLPLASPVAQLSRRTVVLTSESRVRIQARRDW